MSSSNSSASNEHPPSRSTTEVLVVEDDVAARQSLVERVERSSGLKVIGAVGSIAETRTCLRAATPRVLLIDLQLEDGNATPLIAELFEERPDLLMMVISVFGDEHSVIGAIEAGARGYLLKDDSALRVREAIDQLLAGGSPISPSIAAHLIARFQQHPAQKAPDDAAAEPPEHRHQLLTPEPVIVLSARERETLSYAARGYTYAETAELMGVSVNTVSSFTRRIYTKLSVTSRSQAVFEAQKMGLMQPSDD